MDLIEDLPEVGKSPDNAPSLSRISSASREPLGFELFYHSAFSLGKDVTHQDLWELPADYSVDDLCARFNGFWEKQRQKRKYIKKEKKICSDKFSGNFAYFFHRPSILQALFNTFKYEMILFFLVPQIVYGRSFFSRHFVVQNIASFILFFRLKILRDFFNPFFSLQSHYNLGFGSIDAFNYSIYN